MSIEELEKKLQSLLRKTTADMDERILEDASEALRDSAGEGTSIIKFSTVLKLAAAAVIIITIFISVSVFLTESVQETPIEVAEKPEAPAIEKVEQKVPKLEKTEPKVVTEQIKTETQKLQEELLKVALLAKANDIKGLKEVLEQGDITSKLTAADYLGEIGDLQAAGILEKLSVELGADEPNNIFAEAAAKIRSRLGQEKDVVLVEDEEESEFVPDITEDGRKYIYGWLVDINDNPVQGTVQIGKDKVATDEVGAFSITEPNYASLGYSFGQAFDANMNQGRFFILHAGNDKNDIDIVVEPLASLSGFVVDTNEDAVDSYSLEIRPCVDGSVVYKDSIGMNPWTSKIYPDGAFEVNRIPIGMPLQLAAKKPGFETLVKLDELAAGKNLDLGRIIIEPLPDLNEQTQWNCTLSGYLVNENNEPLANAGITVYAGEKIIEGNSDVNGWYEFTKLPQEVQLSIVPFFDGYGNNPFQYSCIDVNSRLDVQIFPQAYDFYNQAAPSLIVREWLNREHLTLDSFKGKSVLLCLGLDYQKEETLFQRLNTLQSDFDPAGEVTLIGVHKYIEEGDPNEGALQQFVNDENIDFPLAVDENVNLVKDIILPDSNVLDGKKISIKRSSLSETGATHSLYEVRAMPSFYLIDPDGMLITCVHQAQFEDLVADLLGL